MSSRYFTKTENDFTMTTSENSDWRCDVSSAQIVKKTTQVLEYSEQP